MGFMNTLSSVAAPLRMRAGSMQDYNRAFFSGDNIPDLWMSSLASSGVEVTPDLALTLSGYYCGVTTILYDLATLPKKTYANRDDGGKDPVRFKDGQMGEFAYMIRYAPNAYHTSAEFFGCMVAQFLMRNRAYAEIVPGTRSVIGALLPRHPDRVTPEMLPSGRVRYRLLEADGTTRYVTQDEMFVVRDLLNADSLTGLSRIQYGAQAIGTILAAEQAAGKFFRSGMTAATVATYAGEMDDEDEADLHKSISRYAAGVENSFGLMLVPDNVTIKNLAVEPEKAQMMLAREWGIKEVARHLRMPGHKLGITGANAYASQVQSALDYVIGCLRPIAVTFEEAIQRDLIIDKGEYFVEFLLDALLRGDPDARAAYYEKAIRMRWMRPSEVHLRENLNPDARLDELSEGDFRPGASGAGATTDGTKPNNASGKVLMHAFLQIHDNAANLVRKERVVVEKMAKKFANDPSAFQSGLREFYAEHAQSIARSMRMPIAIARGFAAQHGSEFEAKGVAIIDGEAGASWEREEAQELASLAVDMERAA